MRHVIKSSARVPHAAHISARRETTASLFRSSSSSAAPTHLPLVFLRHGQSTWNKQNIFIGMTDTPLTEEGELEATSAGEILRNSEYGSSLDAVYTSLLKRSTHTVWIALKQMGLEHIPVTKSFSLNERSYGALVGRNKKQLVEEHGKEQVRLWRRSWDTPPPPMTRDSPYWPYKDPRYAKLGIPESAIPVSESLKDVTKRTSVFWESTIAPQLRKGQRLLIVGHENNLRSLIKRLDGISDEDILHVELPRAIPLVFHLDPHTLKPVKLEGSADGLSGRYLVHPETLKQVAERDHNIVYGDAGFGKSNGQAAAAAAAAAAVAAAKASTSVSSAAHQQQQ